MTGSFHQNSNIDCLYLKHKNGGRGLKCVKTTFEARIVAAKRYLSQRNNEYLACVINLEESKLIIVGRELLASESIDDNENWKPNVLSRPYIREVLKIKTESFINKPLHGYVRKEIIENKNVDQKLTDQWSNNKHMLSHFEACTCAIHEQDITNKNNQQPTNDNKCHLCKVHIEDITHIISSCGKMSSQYYLLIQHNIAKYL